MSRKPEKLTLSKDQAPFNRTEFLTTVCSAYIVMAAIGLFVMRYGHKNLESGLSFGLISFEDISLFAPIWLAIGLLAATAMIAFGALSESWFSNSDSTATKTPSSASETFSLKPEDSGDLDDLDQISSQTVNRVVSNLSYSQLFLIALVSAIGEEILFRGALQPFLGLFLGSCLYGLIQFGPTLALTIWSIMAFARGLLLGWLFMATGSLWPGLVAHLAYNLWTLAKYKRTVPQGPQRQALPQSSKV
jgi:membrane protease YdiL (CAAX protease family)